MPGYAAYFCGSNEKCQMNKISLPAFSFISKTTHWIRCHRLAYAYDHHHSAMDSVLLIRIQRLIYMIVTSVLFQAIKMTNIGWYSSPYHRLVLGKLYHIHLPHSLLLRYPNLNSAYAALVRDFWSLVGRPPFLPLLSNKKKERFFIPRQSKNKSFVIKNESDILNWQKTFAKQNTPNKKPTDLHFKTENKRVWFVRRYAGES